MTFAGSRRPVPRVVVALLSLLVGAFIGFPGTVAAHDPVRPASPEVSHHPAFVTETGEKKWDDCIWAAGAMLIDEWTGHPVDRVALRAASGADAKGASDLRDLRRGVADLLGLDLPASPRMGDRMRWGDLLHRLAHGGGAVVVGWYSSLPARLTRWDRALAAMDPTDDAGHAMFVTDYRPKTGKLWLMDPLGRGDYAGEWVDASVIRDFVWTTSWGYIYAAATPAPVAHRSPRRPVSLGAPEVVGAARAGTIASLGIPVTPGAKGSLGPLGPVLPGLRVQATFEPAGPATASSPDGVPSAVGPAALVPSPSPVSSASPISSSDGASAGPVPAPVIPGQPATLTSTGLVFDALLPSVAGVYEIHVRLLDAHGRQLRGSAATLVAPAGTVAVWDRFGAVWDGDRSVAMAPGAVAPVRIHVTNAGTSDWLPSAAPVTVGRIPASRSVTDQVVAIWTDRPGRPSSATPLALVAGDDAWLDLRLSAPLAPGVYHVLVDLVDPAAGSFAARGVPPFMITVTVDERAATNL